MLNHQHNSPISGKELLKAIQFHTGLPFLGNLNLDSCGLESFPDILNEPTGISSLSLYDNRLVEIPKEIYQLHGLQTLNLGQNLLVSIPEEVGSLEKMEMLD